MRDVEGNASEQSKIRYQEPSHQNNNHVCIKQAEIARLSEKVRTLFIEYEKLNDTLKALNTTQMELLKQITNLSSIINTLKWTITIMIAFFGGLFVFILSEVIKLIH